MSTAEPPPTDPHANIPRFSPAEEAALVAESHTLKGGANALFTASDYDGAVAGYERALAALPSYLDYEMAVLRSNIAACFLRLEEWKRAIEEADKGLEGLDECEKEKVAKGEEDRRVVEIEPGEDEATVLSTLRALPSDEDVLRIRTKLLLRRAKARTETGGWAALQGAQEDYTKLATFPNLTSLDRKTVQSALRTIPVKLEESKQKEMGEMMGKLKQLGNGILKPFGLSADNFNMVKDEKTGGYNLSFQQNQ